MEIAQQLQRGTYDVTLSGKFTFNDNPVFREIIEKIAEKDIRQVVLHILPDAGQAVSHLLLGPDAQLRHNPVQHKQRMDRNRIMQLASLQRNRQPHRRGKPSHR